MQFLLVVGISILPSNFTYLLGQDIALAFWDNEANLLATVNVFDQRLFLLVAVQSNLGRHYYMLFYISAQDRDTQNQLVLINLCVA